jgi:hypothetical protein
MKNLCKVSLAVAIAAAAFSTLAQAQTVELNGLGSSAMWLQLGIAAADDSAIGASCVWSETSNSVSASDTQAAANKPDKGSAWVAWTQSTASGSTCQTVDSSVKVYAYLQTDSVVGNRCLFDGTCTLSYPTSNPSSVGAILGSASEVALPAGIATALSTAPNFAGTDIRPEDAAFATLRATTACDTAVSGQYLGLGYSSGTTILGTSQGQSGSSYFNVVNFSLPSSFTVTPLGAVPVLVVAASSDTTGAGITQFSNITSANLAKLLDGTYSSASDIGGTGSDPIYVFEREPLSGTYNTMEYNVPNTTGNKTSQDVGQNQLTAQQACNSDGTPVNPLSIVTNTTTGAARYRAIGTGNELKATRTYYDANSLFNNLGYGFWSVSNYSGFSSLSSGVTAKYLTVDSVDPLGASGTIPTTTAQINAVSFGTVENGSYPIWSLLRLVTTTSSAATAATTLQSAVQAYVGEGGYPTTRPDFVKLSQMAAVRSHFAPPNVTIGGNLITTLANGDKKLGSGTTYCTATEAGGDVGGVVISLTTDSSYCHTNGVTTGHTGERR